MLNITKSLFLTMIYLLIIKSSIAQIVINEFQASNASTILDFYVVGDHSDWIEIYNAGISAIELDGWYITDNKNDTTKWQIPEDTRIEGHGYYFIWADGSDLEIPPFYDHLFDHANFKLSKSGEEIALYDKNKNLIDFIEYSYLETDVSYGRISDGSDTLVYFGEPTPNAPNSNSGTLNQVFTSSPEFSQKGGLYNSQISISLSTTSPDQKIYYTTDGTFPTNKSQVYTTPIIVDSTTIVRARCFKDGFLPSKIITHSYFIDIENNKLPVISLTAKPENLWGSEGIYTSSKKGVEIPASFEFFDTYGVQQVGQMCDIRLSGQAASLGPQKAFTLSAKGKYGDDIFEYPFFENRNYKDFSDIYLRNSGTPDNFYTLFRDGMTHSLVINKTDIDCQAYRPSKLYLNGEYWGIINIREKINSDYLNNHHNVNTKNLNILEFEGNVVTIEGSDFEFQEMRSFIYENHLSDKDNYNYIASKLDINEFIDYQIAEIFIDNIDWVDRNTKIWKENSYNSKWRYILLDTDVSFGMLWDYLNFDSYYYHNNLAKATEEQNSSTLILRSLLANEEFKNEFIGRFATYMNTIFDSTSTLHLIDSLYYGIYKEMPNHIEKWGDSYYSHFGTPIRNMNDWNYEVDIMREFARKRVSYQQQHIIDYFKLEGLDSLYIEVGNKGTGQIYINNIAITDSSASGFYFRDISIPIKAVPKLGYKFVGWNNNFNTNADTILRINGNTSLVANFTTENISILPDTIKNDTILLKANSPHFSSGDIVVLPNITLEVEAGVAIKMNDKASIWVYGNLLLNGSSENPISIDVNTNIGAKEWGGICFENGTDKSELNFVNILNSSSTNILKHFSGISSYYTDLHLNNITIESKKQPFYSEFGNITVVNSYFHSNAASDLINIKYATTALVENCIFIGNETVDADAIDYDNLNNGIIRGNKITGFIGYNSDAIDLGEGARNILIEDNYISRIADKGISIGQSSTAIIKNNIISNCQQGVGIKDSGSYANIDKNTFFANYYAVACFEKNYGEGGGTATVKNSIMAESEGKTYFIDEHSDIETSYSISNTEALSGIGNLFEDPEFKNNLIYNYELANTSPCINSGDPESPKDTDGSTTDMGAIFTYSNSNNNVVIINEINFNSSNELNSDDWIELYNTTEKTINMAGWSFMDEKNDHLFTFPDGLSLEPNSYFVLCSNDSAFRSQHPYISNHIGNFNFGLSNGGEILRLFDAKLNLINTLNYSDSTPWPINNDGNGHTLELKSEDLNNTLSQNWRSSPYIKGTPGKTNNPETKIDFNLSNIGGCTGLIIAENTTKTTYDSIRWDFGDGTFSTREQVEHVYASAGIYKITLNVFSFYGNESKSTETSFTTIIESPVVYSDTSCGRGSLILNAVANGEILWYENRFDDEAIHLGEQFETPFLSSSKVYYVGNNINNCESNRVPIDAVVFNNALAYFKTEINNGLLTLSNKSANCLSYFWDFGDGSQSTEFEPTHQYTQPGSYVVSLIAYNDYCSTEDDYSVEISVDEINLANIQKQSVFKVYPNPSNGIVNISINNNHSGKIDLKVYNFYGKTIKDYNFIKLSNNFSNSIDLSHLSNGVYLIQIITDEKEYTKKIVIN